MDFLAGFSELLLEAADQFLFLALGIREIIVGEFAIGLAEFAFDDVPISFER